MIIWLDPSLSTENRSDLLAPDIYVLILSKCFSPSTGSVSGFIHSFLHGIQKDYIYVCHQALPVRATACVCSSSEYQCKQTDRQTPNVLFFSRAALLIRLSCCICPGLASIAISSCLPLLHPQSKMCLSK